MNRYLFSVILLLFLHFNCFAQFIEVIQEKGDSDVKITIEIIDSAKLTGDNYEIHFGEQTFYMNSNGDWIETDDYQQPKKPLSKINDQGKSLLIAEQVTYAADSTLDLSFLLKLNAPDYNWVDGVKIDFPDYVKINSAQSVKGNSQGNIIDFKIEGSSVRWGKDENSGSGKFGGEELLLVNIDFTDPTFSVGYEIFDDGWSESYMKSVGDSTYYNLGNGTINGIGTITLTGEISYGYKTDKYWKLFNKSKSIFVSDYQTILSGYDVNTGEKAIEEYELVTDGLKMKITGTFEKPKTLQWAILNKSKKVYNHFGGSVLLGKYEIGDFSNFIDYEDGTSLTTKGYGSDSLNLLWQDYEFRFSGELDSMYTEDSVLVYTTKEGTGSLATFYGANNYQTIDHPLNSERKERFLLRIPFEVWNKEQGIQVNYQFYDRVQEILTGNSFYVWYPYKRMYGEILNTPYEEEVITEEMTSLLSEYFTWNNVWWRSEYTTGDVVEIIYNNPILFTDIYSFQTQLVSSINNTNSPRIFSLEQNYPNPFNPSTIIKYSIPERAKVNLTIFNTLGEEVKILVSDLQDKGSYEKIFDGTGLSSGIYFYQLKVGNNYGAVKKMLLLK